MDSVDFLLLTTIEAETHAVLRKLPNANFVASSQKNCAYLSTISAISPDGLRANYDVVLKPLAGGGSATASTDAIAAIREWNPRCVIVVGLATGISPQVNLGDILIATSIINLETHVSLDKGSVLKTDLIKPSAKMMASTQKFLTQNRTRRQLLQHSELVKPHINLHFGPILSGGKVPLGTETLRALRANWPDLLGIDAEGIGVVQVASTLSNRHGLEILIVRGVSDLADQHRNNNSSIDDISETVSSFVVNFISSGILAPRKKHFRATLSLETMGEPYEMKQIVDLKSRLSRFLGHDIKLHIVEPG